MHSFSSSSSKSNSPLPPPNSSKFNSRPPRISDARSLASSILSTTPNSNDRSTYGRQKLQLSSDAIKKANHYEERIVDFNTSYGAQYRSQCIPPPSFNTFYSQSSSTVVQQQRPMSLLENCWQMPPPPPPPNFQFQQFGQPQPAYVNFNMSGSGGASSIHYNNNHFAKSLTGTGTVRNPNFGLSQQHGNPPSAKASLQFQQFGQPAYVNFNMSGSGRGPNIRNNNNNHFTKSLTGTVRIRDPNWSQQHGNPHSNFGCGWSQQHGNPPAPAAKAKTSEDCSQFQQDIRQMNTKTVRRVYNNSKFPWKTQE